MNLLEWVCNGIKRQEFKQGSGWLVKGQHIILMCLVGGYTSGIKCHRTCDPSNAIASVTKTQSSPQAANTFGINVSQSRRSLKHKHHIAR